MKNLSLKNALVRTVGEAALAHYLFLTHASPESLKTWLSTKEDEIREAHAAVAVVIRANRLDITTEEIHQLASVWMLKELARIEKEEERDIRRQQERGAPWA